MSLFQGVTHLGHKDRLDAAAEAVLVAQFRQQNYETFSKVVDAFQSRVHGFVRRMVSNHEEAEDITQEVFIRAYQSVNRFDGRCSLRTWLFRIAYNLCVDASRKKGRSVQEASMIDANSEEVFDVADYRWNPETLVLDDELMQVVEQSIMSMSEKLRSILLLHDREELGYDELAQMLDIPVGTVKSRLFLARNTVMKAVESYRTETQRTNFYQEGGQRS